MNASIAVMLLYYTLLHVVSHKNVIFVITYNTEVCAFISKKSNVGNSFFAGDKQARLHVVSNLDNRRGTEACKARRYPMT